MGSCHADRSGFDGKWTEDPLAFDNAYFKEMLAKTYTEETAPNGAAQFRDADTGTIMLTSDLALLTDEAFKTHVERFAADQDAYFEAYTSAWVKLQENGCTGLRDAL